MDSLQPPCCLHIHFFTRWMKSTWWDENVLNQPTGPFNLMLGRKYDFKVCQSGLGCIKIEFWLFSAELPRFVSLLRIRSWWCPRVPTRSWRALLDSGWFGPLLSWFAASAASCSVNWGGVRRGWGSSVWGPWRWNPWSVREQDTLWESHLSSANHLKWCLHSYQAPIRFLKGTGHHHQVGCCLFNILMLSRL